MRWLAAAIICLSFLTGAARAADNEIYFVRYDHWSDADERGYQEFIAAIGEADCHTVNDCLHAASNPFRASDAPDTLFNSDCSDLPYLLRFYYAWKRGLPFSYTDTVEPIGSSQDWRYSRNGNRVVSRYTIPSGTLTFQTALAAMEDAVSTATYRVHPDSDAADFYSPAIDPKSIKPGTVLYDPNGHVAIVYRVDSKGRVFYMDAHPDHSVTHVFYDLRFTRTFPSAGAGFKNWRPQVLVGARRRADGTLTGGHIEVARNAAIPDFSTEQFFGTGTRPADADWATGGFTLNGEQFGYYDYVRAKLAGGTLEFDPVSEVRDMVQSNCSDLHYREQAVQVALAAGIEVQSQPTRLPPNIYGTVGPWEVYSTPSRDARLKTAFKELRDSVERFVEMFETGDKHLHYDGKDLVSDLVATYQRETAACQVTYTRSDASQVTLGYEDARKRLFQMSFDPYQCVERRWGAQDATELATCRDDANKQAWYAAEQYLRNQTDRTYGAQMDYSLSELASGPGPGKGIAEPPDTDVLAYLSSKRGATRGLGAGDVSVGR